MVRRDAVPDADVGSQGGASETKGDARETQGDASESPSLSPGRSSATARNGDGSREGAKPQKKTRKEFWDGFLNAKGQAAAVMDEAVPFCAWRSCDSSENIPPRTSGRSVRGIGLTTEV